MAQSCQGLLPSICFFLNASIESGHMLQLWGGSISSRGQKYQSQWKGVSALGQTGLRPHSALNLPAPACTRLHPFTATPVGSQAVFQQRPS